MPTVKRFCERCERVTQDGHQWCPDRDCPAERGYPVFDYGDYVADMKVQRIIAVWRTAVLYEAKRSDKPVWLKVSHVDPTGACEDKLKREAAMLQARAPKIPRGAATFRPQSRLRHLTWLPPYPTPANRAYGEVTIDGETRVYAVYGALEGSLLSQVLGENPDIWHSQAAWITTSVAQALQPLVAAGQVNLCLTPDTIFVDKDRDGHYRAVLLDYGWMLASRDVGPDAVKEIVRRCEPAYSAPEILAGIGAQALTTAADTYSLGMILYEMLAGRPGYEPKLHRDDRQKGLVIGTRSALLLHRPELGPAGVPDIITRAIAPRERYASVTELGKTITAAYGPQPVERIPRPIRFYVAIGVILALSVVALVVGGYVIANARPG